MKGWLGKSVVAAMSFAGVTGTASAQACAGFEDVLETDTAVCPAVEWVKNRGVTLGCSDTAHYCPLNNVTRAQMALFMQRLGNALSSNVLHNQHSINAFTVPEDGANAQLVCFTETIPAAPFDRQVTLNGSITLYAAAGPVNVRVFALIHNGTSWSNFYPPTDSVAQRATVPPGGWGGAAVTETVFLPAGNPYRFSLGIRRDGVATSSGWDINQGRCQVTASVSNAPEVPL